MSKHNLIEYALARDAVKDLPQIQEALNELYTKLYKYRSYLCAQHVLDATSDSLTMITRQYLSAKKIVKEKGVE